MCPWVSFLFLSLISSTKNSLTSSSDVSSVQSFDSALARVFDLHFLHSSITSSVLLVKGRVELLVYSWICSALAVP
jgi:hypothetical protein